MGFFRINVHTFYIIIGWCCMSSFGQMLYLALTWVGGILYWITTLVGSTKLINIRPS